MTASSQGSGTGSRADRLARERGYCCAVDAETNGGCSHLRAVVRQGIIEEEVREAEEIAGLGPRGIAELARLGDPWAENKWLELRPSEARTYLEARYGGAAAAHGDAWPSDPGQSLGDRAAVESGTAAGDARAAAPAGAPTGARDEVPVHGKGRARLDRPALDVFSRVYERSGAGLGVDLNVLASMPPGPALAGLLAGIDVASIDGFAALEVLAAFKRQEAWSAANAARVASALARKRAAVVAPPRPGVRPVDGTQEEIAMRLAVSRLEAAKLIRVGDGMAHTFHETGAALQTGEIDYRKAAQIITTLDGTPGPVGWFVEQEVLAEAGRRTPGQLTRDLAKALIAVDPEEAERRHLRARRTRSVTHPMPLPDGMGRITATLGASECVQVDLVLDSVARAAKARGDARTKDQLRADALFALVVGAVHTGWAGPRPDAVCQCERCRPRCGAGSPVTPEPSQDVAIPSTGCSDDVMPPLELLIPPVRGMPLGRSLRTQVHVTVPLAVVLPPGVPGGRTGDNGGAGPAADDRGRAGPPTATDSPASQRTVGPPAPVPPDAPDAPVSKPPPDDADLYDRPLAPVAELAGYGPITPDVARALAAGGTWRRIVTDPESGMIRDIGRARYRPPADLVEYVRARDGGCFRPGCAAPPSACEIEHTQAWSQGGVSADHNLGNACKRDHQVKTSGEFTVIQPTPGVFEWLTPTGHAYRREMNGTITMLPAPPAGLSYTPPDF